MIPRWYQTAQDVTGLAYSNSGSGHSVGMPYFLTGQISDTLKIATGRIKPWCLSFIELKTTKFIKVNEEQQRL